MLLSVRGKHLGRGGAVYRAKMRHLKTGTVLNLSFRPVDKFEMLDFDFRPATFLYQDKEAVYFMDNRSFEQISLPVSLVKEMTPLFKEGEVYKIKYIDEEAIGVQLPLKVKRKVLEAPEAVAGNTATAATKIVKIEGGIEVETPLFIKKGDVIVINTEKRTYVERSGDK